MLHGAPFCMRLHGREKEMEVSSFPQGCLWHTDTLHTDITLSNQFLPFRPLAAAPVHIVQALPLHGYHLFGHVKARLRLLMRGCHAGRRWPLLQLVGRKSPKT